MSKFQDVSDSAGGSVVAPEDASSAVGRRIGTIVDRVGMDKCVQFTGKSAKQIKRYEAGAEPPLGVLLGLARASGASVEWIARGVDSTPLNEELLSVVIATLEEDLASRRRTLAPAKKAELIVLAYSIVAAETEHGRRQEIISRLLDFAR